MDHLEVPSWLVFANLAVFVLLGTVSGQQVSSSACLSAWVLTVGAVILLLSPNGLGEADVIYVAGLAWLLSFWHLLLAIALACALAGVAFLVLSGFRRQSHQAQPIAFLPFLFFGGLAALVGA